MQPERQFGVCPSSIKHTVREAQKDVTSMVGHLLSEQVTIEQSHRQSGGFEDPIAKGMHKVSTGWLAKYLSKTDSDGFEPAENEDTEIDVKYEFYDINWLFSYLCNF